MFKRKVRRKKEIENESSRLFRRLIYFLQRDIFRSRSNNEIKQLVLDELSRMGEEEKRLLKDGYNSVEEGVMKHFEQSASIVEKEWPIEQLGDLTHFELGTLCGKVLALDWAQMIEWDQSEANRVEILGGIKNRVETDEGSEGIDDKRLNLLLKTIEMCKDKEIYSSIMEMLLEGMEKDEQLKDLIEKNKKPKDD